MSHRKSEAVLVSEITKIGQSLPLVVAALPKELDTKAYAGEAQRLDGAIATANKKNQERKAALDDKRQQMKAMQEMLKRIRACVKGHYGDDSTEYALVGGKRLSERKKPVRKPKQAAA